MISWVPSQWRRDKQRNNSLFRLGPSEKEERFDADINIHADNHASNVTVLGVLLDKWML